MEILTRLPPPSAMTPLRRPSAVEDGDAGPSNNPYYRRGQKPGKMPQEETSEDPPPQVAETGPHIDIRV